MVVFRIGNLIQYCDKCKKANDKIKYLLISLLLAFYEGANLFSAHYTAQVARLVHIKYDDR